MLNVSSASIVKVLHDRSGNPSVCKLGPDDDAELLIATLDLLHKDRQSAFCRILSDSLMVVNASCRKHAMFISHLRRFILNP